jgi:(p)ppGpp synthase/HD superfamily hydrolase
MLTQRYIDAVALAFELHREQTRKGTGIPYISHLFSVSALALEYGADEDEAIAALLHDAAEDQGGAATIGVIRGRFGDRVADIVVGCSDSLADEKLEWRARKEAYLAHLAAAGASVALVSGCDKLHNARSILSDLHRVGDALWDRFTGGRDGVLWYYAGLCESLTRSKAPAVDEFRRVLAAIQLIAHG